ncbi:MAG: hypothetical protein CBC33_006615 [Coraliomargarita sp. TMED73]|nr:MAG: hypothetical protein CBC33_006615 [Coraliomargarita sp. TMED73]
MNKKIASVPNEEVSFSSDFVACSPGDGGCDELDERLSHSWLRVGIAAVFAGQGMALSLALSMTPPEFGTGGLLDFTRGSGFLCAGGDVISGGAFISGDCRHGAGASLVY